MGWGSAGMWAVGWGGNGGEMTALVRGGKGTLVGGGGVAAWVGKRGYWDASRGRRESGDWCE